MDGKGIIIINYFLHHNIFRSLFYFGTLNRLEISKIKPFSLKASSELSEVNLNMFIHNNC